MPSRQTQEVPISLGSLGIPVFKVNYEGNKHLTVPGLSCPYPKAISSDAPNRALVVLAIRRCTCPFPSSPTFREVMMGWEAVDDVFHAEPRGRHSPSQCELPPSYLECWQNTFKREPPHQGASNRSCLSSTPEQNYVHVPTGCRQSGRHPWGGDPDSPQSLGLCYLGRLSGPGPLDITGQHVNWAPGRHSASLTTSNSSSRALSAGWPPDFQTSV